MVYVQLNLVLILTSAFPIHILAQSIFNIPEVHSIHFVDILTRNSIPYDWSQMIESLFSKHSSGVPECYYIRVLPIRISADYCTWLNSQTMTYKSTKIIQDTIRMSSGPYCRLIRSTPPYLWNCRP